MTDTNLDFWWPSPEAFEDLVVEDSDTGFLLSAPDDTECGEWLAYWNQNEEFHTLFEQEFTKVLRVYAQSILEKYGETENQSDEQSSNREQAENDSAGTLS